MKRTTQKLLKNETFVAILLIFFTTVITYGVSIPKLGYYYDDWLVMWSGHVRGAASLISLTSTDRPFMGIIYSLVYRLLGDAPINWHLYALLWRFLGGLAFFWILRLLWPREKYITTLMTVLFIVYPGFLAQPNANTKQNHLYGFGAALLSIALMLQALKTNARGWKIVCSVLAILLTANYLWIYEYMIGFEGTRLILLGYVLFQQGSRDFRSLAKGTLRRIWPYWIVTAGFLYWRLFIFTSTRKATNVSGLAVSYLSDIRHMSLRLIVETAKDFLDTSFFAWFVQPYQLFSMARYRDLGYALLIAGIVASLVLLYTFLSKKWWEMDGSEAESPRLTKKFLWIGALAIVCAIVPVVVSDRQVDLFDTYKAYGLHPIPGVILFITGMMLILPPKFRRFVIVSLVGISVSTQILNADNWGQYWQFQRSLWWQLAWRAPDIEDNTLVMTYSDVGYNPAQDYMVWAPVNLIYNPIPAETPAIQAEVLNSGTAYSIIKKAVVDDRLAGIEFQKHFDNVLLISVSSLSSCLHAIDGRLPVYSISEPLLIEKVGAYSHIERIIPSADSPVPPFTIFGPEPEHGWCYYYERASLARQKGDWKEVGSLYNQVRDLKLNTDDKSEWVPFFEGLVNLGRVDDARSLYKRQIRVQPEIRFSLCDSLATDPGYPSEFGYDYKTIDEILCK